jgi:hypothetical protein
LHPEGSCIRETGSYVIATSGVESHLDAIVEASIIALAL